MPEIIIKYDGDYTEVNSEASPNELLKAISILIRLIIHKIKPNEFMPDIKFVSERMNHIINESTKKMIDDMNVVKLETYIQESVEMLVFSVPKIEDILALQYAISRWIHFVKAIDRTKGKDDQYE